MEDYKKHFCKRLEKEPRYSKVAYECKYKRRTIITDAGVTIKSTSGGGILIQYTKLNGNKITSLVFREVQYIEEYYKISLLAEAEHPQPIKVVEPKKKNFIEEEDFDKRIGGRN